MELSLLSKQYSVQKLKQEDLDDIYRLCSKNVLFYRHHPPFVTKESILDDMSALPPGKDYSDKYYIGFFKDIQLIAVMDLIFDYPSKKTAYIGFFMVDMEFQNKGIGSKIIAECKEYLKSIGYMGIHLGVDKGNPQSFSFWTKNNFTVIDENQYLHMECMI